MTTVTTSHIVLDDHGKALIAGSRTKVTLVVRDMMGGMTPEQIHKTYPHLSLAQIHAALAYYYDNKSALDAEMDRQDHDVEAIQAQDSAKRPARAELERRLREREKQP